MKLQNGQTSSKAYGVDDKYRRGTCVCLQSFQVCCRLTPNPRFRVLALVDIVAVRFFIQRRHLF